VRSYIELTKRGVHGFAISAVVRIKRKAWSTVVQQLELAAAIRTQQHFPGEAPVVRHRLALKAVPPVLFRALVQAQGIV
jgi:hypothetical protein